MQLTEASPLEEPTQVKVSPLEETLLKVFPLTKPTYKASPLEEPTQIMERDIVNKKELEKTVLRSPPWRSQPSETLVKGRPMLGATLPPSHPTRGGLNLVNLVTNCLTSLPS